MLTIQEQSTDLPMFDVDMSGGFDFSRRAGLKSSAMKAAVKDAVVQLVAQEGCVTGLELNELYALRWERYGWPQVAADSPRKRAGELVRDRRLRVLNLDAPRGTGAEYTLLGVTA